MSTTRQTWPACLRAQADKYISLATLDRQIDLETKDFKSREMLAVGFKGYIEYLKKKEATAAY